MKRLLAKIGRFFGSRGFLKFCLWTATLIILFYVEEDWRGARMWAATKAKWEGKGVSFDSQAYFPKPIPDSENLAAIPLFATTPDPDIANALEPLALRKALRSNEVGNEIFAMGNFQGGDLPDIAKLQGAIATVYGKVFKEIPHEGTLAQLDALFPFVTDLRQVSANLPFCYFKQDYSGALPAARPLGLLTTQIGVAKVLALHAVMALAEQQPGVALDDLKVNFKLISGMRRDPTLVAALVAMGMNAIGNVAIADGLARHAWNDAQLAEIEEKEARIDFLQTSQFALKGEAITQIAPNLAFFKRKRTLNIRAYFDQPDGQKMAFAFFISSLWPDGWFEQNEARSVSLLLESTQAIDPQAHRIFPTRATEVEKRVKLLTESWDAYAPWNCLASETMPSLISGTAHFAQAQVLLDQPCLACALERYRLARGAYPESLTELAPSFISNLPHDVVGGEAYRYRLRPDGTFLLYSIGWNERDDGGLLIYEKDKPNHPDPQQGDWVWPTMKAAESSP